MNAKPQFLGLIPARAGSKGIPGKNMKLLGGKPLIAYTLESAQCSKLLDKIIVSSDCEKTVDFARQYAGIEVPFLRPAEFSGDQSPTTEVVKHALEHYAKAGVTFDYVVLLQPTTPFRGSDLIDRCITHLLKTKSDSLVTIQKIPDRYNPHWALEQQADCCLQFFSHQKIITRRQDLPATFYRDGKIYITHKSLIEKGEMLGGKIAGFITENEPNINIDTPYDWQLAEREVRRICKKESAAADHQ
ncbi:acylneuraminate cytidylyltransferase family protein [Dyadobacter luticola]|uniref:Acylneuraminate cytidylyltransferase family protein n=1 Tax=Dyadobacter luticola TaxID=1979387 RepID=A0A5R9KQ03_9BACT|nr:acylneuraminate cytidylyltransferase family protein [Dyadobacter luticola]TLU98198.1 acylneuraminate cytidylyltransferase family protein [Dyadobacter luticola]